MLTQSDERSLRGIKKITVAHESAGVITRCQATPNEKQTWLTSVKVSWPAEYSDSAGTGCRDRIDP